MTEFNIYGQGGSALVGFLLQPGIPPTGGDTSPAQPGIQGTPGGAAPPPAQPGGGMSFMFLLFGLMIFMIFITTMSGRKEKKRRAAMLSTLAKHDRVQTLGGMIGTISEIRDNEVVVKVDESTNTKIRFARSAVQQVLKKSGSDDTDDTDERLIEPGLAQTQRAGV